MSNGFINGEYLTDIADAIREKFGVEDTFYPEDMGEAIRELEYDTVDLEVIENGTYYPPDGVLCFSSVDVNVVGDAELVTLLVTSNGTYKAEDYDCDGFESVTADVQLVGTNPDDGKNYIVTVDEDGELVYTLVS